MNRTRTTLYCFFGLTCPLVTISAHADMSATLTELLAVPTDSSRYAYEMTYEDGKQQISAHVDPSQAEGKRVTVFNPTPDQWSDDLETGVSEIEADPMDGFWCYEFADSIPADATLVKQEDGAETYTFAPLPDPDDEDDVEFVKHLRGQVTIDKRVPAILSFSLEAPKPFKPSLVVKVKEFRMQATCAQLPDGQTYLSRLEIRAVASAFFKTLVQYEQRTISNPELVD